MGIEHITIEARSATLAALDACDTGFDFADALHVARSWRATACATFDQRLAKRARGMAAMPPVEVLQKQRARESASLTGGSRCPRARRETQELRTPPPVDTASVARIRAR
jgi:hypothetical protein